MPPPPIPARKEESHTEPPPIPVPKEAGHPAEPPPIPIRQEEEEAQPEPEPEPEPSAPRSPPKWRPAGAVATVMASSGQGWRPSASRPERGEDVEQQEEEHSTNPYDLKAASGSIVTASYPFQGEADLQQLSFTVGDTIKVKQKEEMWSWGVLERGGAEGWFPHNYVGSTFKPLPGIHEMAQKIKERRERLEGAAAATSAATSDAPGATSDAPGSTLPGGADAPDTSLPSGAGSAGAVGTDGDGGGSGDAPKVGEEANEAGNPKDAGASEKGSGEGNDGADGANKSGHTKESSSGGDADGGDLNKSTSSELVRKKSTEVDGENKPSLSSAATAARSASAAPSLPPFLKGGGNASEVVTTPAVVVTQRAPEATKDSEVVSATPIEGVGYAGAPIEATPKCKCCIM